MARLDFDELNSEIRYLMFSVFQVEPGVLGRRSGSCGQGRPLVLRRSVEDKGVVVRGIYDVAGMRADADFMIWTHSASIERCRPRTRTSAAPPTWASSALRCGATSRAPSRRVQQEPRSGVHRGRGSGRLHLRVPVRPLLEWYLLPDEERRKMLADHGMAARTYKDVRANTVPAFALGDYEWILAFEAPELHPHRRSHARPARHRGSSARARGGARSSPDRGWTSRSWSFPCPDLTSSRSVTDGTEPASYQHMSHWGMFTAESSPAR